MIRIDYDLGKHKMPDELIQQSLYDPHIALIDVFPRPAIQFNKNSKCHQISALPGETHRVIFRIINSTAEAWPEDSQILNDSNEILRKSSRKFKIALNGYRIAFLTFIIEIPTKWVAQSQKIRFFIFSE